MRQRPALSGRSIAALVLERDPEAHAVARDRAVLDRHVLADDLRDAQVPDALARRFDRVARGRLPRLRTHTDDLGDAVDAVRYSGSPSDRLTVRGNSCTRDDGAMATFLELHTPGSPLLMPNPWDAGSAKLLASLGFQALAT